MTDVRAAGAYVSVSVRDEMRAGLQQAQAKIAAFAEYTKSKTGNMFSMDKLGSILAGGAVIGMLTKIAMNNEHVSQSASKAAQSVQRLFDTFISQNQEEVTAVFSAVEFVLNKLVNGFRAIIAIVQDFGDVITANSFSFENFNKVLDTLDPEPVNTATQAVKGMGDAIKQAVAQGPSMKQIIDDLARSAEIAKSAGRGDIERLLREKEVAKLGEEKVRAEEIYNETLKAQLDLVQKMADAKQYASIDERKAAEDAARDQARKNKEQFEFLTEQKRLRDAAIAASELENQKRQEAVELEKQKAEQQAEAMNAWKQSPAMTKGMAGTFEVMASGSFTSQFDTSKNLLQEAKEQKRYLRDIRDGVLQQRGATFQ